MTAKRAAKAVFAIHGKGLAMYVIEAEGLTKTYGDGEIRVEALQNVNFKAEQGTFVAVVGPSGSGKTTLLHILGGIEHFNSGRILLEGRDISSMSDDERTLLRRQKIGFVFQSFNLMPTLTAEENVLLPLELDGALSPDLRKRAAEKLELVGMSHRSKHVPGNLSGGEQQRVAIARALVIEPAFLLADEPTGNLDSANGRQVIALLRELADRNGQTIIMVTHDKEVAEQADRIVRLRDGRVESEQTIMRR
jgi:putative ABC transport system ATP-binding protein